MWKRSKDGLARWIYERKIRSLLRRLGRQRIFLTGKGAVWIVEGSFKPDSWEEASMIRTCHMRGWVEQVGEAIPRAPLPADVERIFADPFEPVSVDPIYRLTEAGWQTINRTHLWLLATFAVSALALLATILGLLVSQPPNT